MNNLFQSIYKDFLDKCLDGKRCGISLQCKDDNVFIVIPHYGCGENNHESGPCCFNISGFANAGYERYAFYVKYVVRK